MKSSAFLFALFLSGHNAKKQYHTPNKSQLETSNGIFRNDRKNAYLNHLRVFSFAIFKLTYKTFDVLRIHTFY